MGDGPESENFGISGANRYIYRHICIKEFIKIYLYSIQNKFPRVFFFLLIKESNILSHYIFQDLYFFVTDWHWHIILYITERKLIIIFMAKSVIYF